MVQKKTQPMTRGGQDLLRLNPFTVLLDSVCRNMVHVGALSCVCLLLFSPHPLVFRPCVFGVALHFYSVVTQLSKPKEQRLWGKKGGTVKYWSFIWGRMGSSEVFQWGGGAGRGFKCPLSLQAILKPLYSIIWIHLLSKKVVLATTYAWQTDGHNRPSTSVTTVGPSTQALRPLSGLAGHIKRGPDEMRCRG